MGQKNGGLNCKICRYISSGDVVVRNGSVE